MGRRDAERPGCLTWVPLGFAPGIRVKQAGLNGRGTLHTLPTDVGTSEFDRMEANISPRSSSDLSLQQSSGPIKNDNHSHC